MTTRRLTQPARALLAALLLLTAAAPRRAHTQQTAGSIAGQAVAAESGAIIPLALVRLLPDAGDEELREILTDARGEFRFDGVLPGRYRLRMDRVGYASRPTEPFEVRMGETTRRTLRSGMQAVELEGLTVSGNACFTLDRLDDAPDLAALWREAQKALETRRSFQRQYRYTYDRRVAGVGRLRLFRDKRIVQDTTILSTPDSAAVREARRRETRAREGYGTKTRTSILLSVPDEMELLDDRFLTTHCLEGDPGDGSAGYTLRFRPVRRPADGRVDVRGEMRIDAAGYGVRELVYEYLDGGRRFARVAMRYEDVSTPDGVIRLPATGTVSGDPGGLLGVLLQDFHGTIAIGGFRGFERVR